MSNIILPPVKPIQLLSAAGEFMFEKYRLKSYGKRELIYRDDFWRPNLITNIGLDYFAQGEFASYLKIGTGTTAPAFTDTALAGYAASSSYLTQISEVNAGAPNYESLLTNRYEFAAGVLNGTYTEIGLSWSNGNTANSLMTRALILDGSGNPTSISVVGPDELLQVTYRMTVYPSLADVSGSVNITGSGTHAFTARRFYAPEILNPMRNQPFGKAFNIKAFTGDLVSITAPSLDGAFADMGGGLAAYTPGTYTLGLNVTAGLGQANLPGGIKSMQLNVATPVNRYIVRTQIAFTPAIPKTETQSLTLPFSFSWGRH